jgi:tRNA A58 N-methylase Trm61
MARRTTEHDVVLLRQRGDKRPKWRLTPALRAGQRVKLPHGAHVSAEDLIGRSYLEKLKDNHGREVIVHEASMSSYIINTERLATPIYPHDASAIVAMMDIHPERPDEGEPAAAGENEGEQQQQQQQPFEVFEAGTGMGSLTLHIARALHAGNRGMTREMRDAVAAADIKRRNTANSDSSEAEESDSAELPSEQADVMGTESRPLESLTLSRLDVSPELQQQFDQWRSARRTILHTLDRNPKHSREAYRFIRRFRRGMYLPDIDFHIGSIPDYLGPRLEASGGKPFLSRAVLDLPAAHDVAEIVVQALRPNGLLLVFNPSISQIAEVAAWSVKTGQPLRLERVSELANTTSVGSDDAGLNDGGGGRTWDLRTVMPKRDAAEGEVVQVMRPKVGERVAGGGFVAVFRRWPDRDGGMAGDTEAPPAEGSPLEDGIAMGVFDSVAEGLSKAGSV